MKQASFTAEKPTPGLTRNVLSRPGLDCTIIGLAPMEEIYFADERSPRDHIVFVVEGRVIATLDGLTFILNKDDALHIEAGKEHVITGGASGWSKLLRIDVAPRKLPAPVFVTFPGA